MVSPELARKLSPEKRPPKTMSKRRLDANPLIRVYSIGVALAPSPAKSQREHKSSSSECCLYCYAAWLNATG